MSFYKLPMIIDNELKNEIISFATETGLEYFQPNGNSRRFCNVNKFDLEISHRIRKFASYCYTDFYGIKIQEEPKYGNFIGVNDEGGFVHPHKDSKGFNKEHHIRFNFLISKPMQGGMPVLNNIKYLVEENCGWLNIADKWIHSSTPVVGHKQRIVLSLGNLIDGKNLSRILDKL